MGWEVSAELKVKVMKLQGCGDGIGGTGCDITMGNQVLVSKEERELGATRPPVRGSLPNLWVRGSFLLLITPRERMQSWLVEVGKLPASSSTRA